MKKIYGFSLVEVLISLITISLIMSAFAPVITKKVHTNIALGDGSKKSKPFPYNPLDPNCEAHENYIDCKFKTPDNISRISAVIISGGGGGAGATTGNKTTNQNAETSSGYKDIPITKHMKNVTITNLTGGGGGGGGGSFKNWSETKTENKTEPCSYTAPSSSFCANYNSMYVPAAWNGSGGKDLCVMKTNIECNTSLITTGRVCANSHGMGCSNGGYNGNSTYTGCNRVLSNFNYATAYCSSYAPSGTTAGQWRLPTTAELEGWTRIISPESPTTPRMSKCMGSAGIQLCDGTKTGVKTCSEICPGGADYEAPFMIYDNANNKFSLVNGSFAKFSNPGAYTVASARCVYDGTLNGKACEPKTVETKVSVPYYTSSGGGGGAQGAVVSGVVIPDNIIISAIGGKIRLTAGAGGTGGTKGASNGASGGTGGTGGSSSVTVYNSSGSAIYTISTQGGAGGKGASIINAGAGGSASNTCTGTPCSQQNPAGNTGTINANKTTNTTSQGGSASGSNYGMGGAGGSATGTSSNNGTTGNNGHAKITYDLHYDGAAGGGGGGSTLTHIDNIAVTPNKEYIVRIGGGGKGGSTNSNGNDGGESAIWFDNISYISTGGKGGKKGTNQTSTTNAIQGTGGEKGKTTKTGNGGNIFLQKEGTNGANATTNTTGSTGGAGGTSGGQTTRACAGLQTITNICSNPSINGETLPLEEHGNIYKDGNYGLAGSGGGGGSYHNNTSLHPYPGTGGKGQNGYVYIYY